MIVKNIVNYIEKNDLKVTEFAKKCGLRPTTIYSLINGQTKNPTLEVLIKLSETMGMTIDELTKNDKQETDEIKKIYEKIKDLDNEDKSRIYAIMNGAIQATREFNEK